MAKFPRQRRTAKRERGGDILSSGITPLSFDLLAYLRDRDNPLVLMGFDETSGTTALDSSGNGNDASYEGAFALAQAGLFEQDGAAVQLGISGVGGGYAHWPTYPATVDGNHTFVACVKHADDIAAEYIFDHASPRLIVGSQSRTDLGYFDGTWRTTPYKVVYAAVLSWVLDETALSGTSFVNGLPVFTKAYSPSTLPGTEAASYNATNSGSQERTGLNSLFVHANRAVSKADIYDTYRTLTSPTGKPADGQQHYFKETIVDDLGLATLGVQGDVVCHLPLWETAGTQAIDVSMYENHASFVGGPVLGQEPPPDSGLVHSIRCDAGSSVELDNSTFDWSSDWTIAFWAIVENANRALFGVNHGGTGGYVDVFGSTSGQVYLRASDDGSNFVNSNTGVSMEDGEWHRFVGRADFATDTLTLFVDGVSQGASDISGLTMPTLTGETAVINRSRLKSGSTQHYAGWTQLQSALTDAQCEAL